MIYNLVCSGHVMAKDVRGYLEKKIEHLERHVRDNTATKLDVDIRFDTGLAGKKYSSAFTLALDGDVLRAQASGDSVYEVIDLAVGELTQELAKRKGKRESLVRRGAVKAKEMLRALRR